MMLCNWWSNLVLKLIVSGLKSLPIRIAFLRHDKATFPVMGFWDWQDELHGSVQTYVLQIVQCSENMATSLFSVICQKCYNKSLWIVFHMQVEKYTHLAITASMQYIVFEYETYIIVIWLLKVRTYSASIIWGILTQ